MKNVIPVVTAVLLGLAVVFAVSKPLRKREEEKEQQQQRRKNPWKKCGGRPYLCPKGISLLKTL